MIPITLSSSEAQRLLDLGRAWLAGPEWLITRRARYAWDAATQRYTRRDAPEAPAAPRATASLPPWAAGAPGPVPGLERVAQFFERIDPQRQPPIGQPRLGLSRLGHVLILVGLGLLVASVWLALTAIGPLSRFETLWPCAPTETVCLRGRAELQWDFFVRALPAWWTVSLWLYGSGLLLRLGTARYSLLARWLWARPTA